MGLHHTFKYPVAELLTALQENRAKHKEAYDSAVINYRILLKKELTKMLDEVEAGGDVSHVLSLRKPEQHLEEYDQAIKMLQMTSDKEIELDGNTFAQLVMDKWAWQSSFTANTMSYSGKR